MERQQICTICGLQKTSVMKNASNRYAGKLTGGGKAVCGILANGCWHMLMLQGVVQYLLMLLGLGRLFSGSSDSGAGSRDPVTQVWS